jgi:hypothetical protein
VKRLAALLVFAAMGTFAGTIAACVVLTFAPVCGYDCENRSFAIWLLITAACFTGFMVFGYLFTRGARLTFRRVSLVAVFLTTTVLFGATCFYVVDLRRHYADAEAARPVSANFEFMLMSIATRDVQSYTKAENGAVKPLAVISQWERCALDGAWCDTKPRQAHLLCKAGVVYVNEADWSAFTLIPKENLRGSIPMKSMNLCAADNISDN